MFFAVAPTLWCLALEARWTPAADGGPARFSKRYRDAQGIDDSRWIGRDDDQPTGVLQLFPSTPEGWLLAILAAGLLWVLYTQQHDANAGGSGGGARRARVGGDASGASSQAGEAARAAFLKKYG